MDVQIKDSEALRRVSPTMLCEHTLKPMEWVQEETWRNRILVWSITVKTSQATERS